MAEGPWIMWLAHHTSLDFRVKLRQLTKIIIHCSCLRWHIAPTEGMSQRVICEVRFDAGLEEFFQTMTGASAENLSVTQEQPVTLLDCERSYIPTGTHPPYRTLKAWMGSTHFLNGILNQVSTEMIRHMLACNLKPLINIPGIEPLFQTIQA